MGRRLERPGRLATMGRRLERPGRLATMGRRLERPGRLATMGGGRRRRRGRGVSRERVSFTGC